MSSPPGWWRKLRRELGPQAMQQTSRRKLGVLMAEGEGWEARRRQAEGELCEAARRQEVARQGRRSVAAVLRLRLGPKFRVLRDLHREGDEWRTVVMLFASVGLRQSDAELVRRGWVKEKEVGRWVVTRAGVRAIAGR